MKITPPILSAKPGQNHTIESPIKVMIAGSKMALEVRQKIRAFTLVEMLVCVAIIVVLLAILLPTLTRGRTAAQTAKCVSNQRQLVSAIILYAGDNDGTLPLFGGYSGQGSSTWDGASFWDYQIMPYLNPPKSATDYSLAGDSFMRCPAARKDSGSTYGVNYPIVFGVRYNTYFPGSMKLASVPVNTILTTDVEGMNCFYSPWVFPFNSSSGQYGGGIDSFGSYKFNFARPRHDGNIVCSFADGHIKVVPIRDFIKNENNMWGPISH